MNELHSKQRSDVGLETVVVEAVVVVTVVAPATVVVRLEAEHFNYATKIKQFFISKFVLYRIYFSKLTAGVLQLSVLQKHQRTPFIVLEVSADDKGGLNQKLDVQPLRIASIQKRISSNIMFY